MNTWIAGKDLMKHHCLIKRFLYIACSLYMYVAYIYSLNMEDITDIIIDMQKEYLKFLIIKIMVIIMIYMSKVVHY